MSIQHDLKTDPDLPKTGSLYQRRMPLWKRGVENIQFVLKELKRVSPTIDTKKVILIGHSNGGDISMLFANNYPHQVSEIVSLDSLRMPFPKNMHFQILSLRANDTQADEGVLPDKKDQHFFKIQIIPLKDAKHIDLCDRGTATIKKEVTTYIVDFLNKK